MISSGELATPGTARGTRVGHGRSRHADDIDEQRTSSSLGRRRTFKDARVVGEIVSSELRVAEFYHQVRYVVATEHRERGVRIILNETVFSLTPERNELAGLHMPGQTSRAVSEAHRHRVHSLQDELSVLKRYVLRVLHKEHIHLARLLPGRSPGYQRIFIGRLGWRLRMGRR